MSTEPRIRYFIIHIMDLVISSLVKACERHDVITYNDHYVDFSKSMQYFHKTVLVGTY